MDNRCNDEQNPEDSQAKYQRYENNNNSNEQGQYFSISEVLAKQKVSNYRQLT
jgi:hypothetical protein